MPLAWQVAHAMPTWWMAVGCVVELGWQLPHVHVGVAFAFVVTSDALRAMAARRISSTATG